MEYIIAILIGYFFGCSSMSFYISKIKNIKLKENGSKNYGASNTLMLVGKKAALLVLVHDILKSFLAMKLLEFMFDGTLYIGVIAGICAIFGHIFPFYLKFNGGKGFASYIGLLFGINPLFALINIFVIVIVSFLSNYMSAP
jgi:glycerol-3-phosphate acyltransferase PlsY